MFFPYLGRYTQGAVITLLVFLPFLGFYIWRVFQVFRCPEQYVFTRCKLEKFHFSIFWRTAFFDLRLEIPEVGVVHDETAAIFVAHGLGAPLIEDYVNRGDEVIYTRDTHGEDYLHTPEGKKLPVEHCIKGTKGWEIYDGLYVDGCRIIDKPNFGWPHWDEVALEAVELIGLCTDICVVSNALIIKAMHPDIPVSVDKSCCAGVTVASHEAALQTMAMCQINVIGG
jgi:hypothetical protein